VSNDSISPPYLKAGDRLRAIAPSGAVAEYTALEKGVEIWQDRGYQVEFDPYYCEKAGYLAGSDDRRRESLTNAWRDPDCKAILCVRGGYGSTRLLERWQWTATHPKWLVGFSDATGLLWSLAKVGIGGLHAPMLTTLAAEPLWSRNRLFEALEGLPLSPLQGTGWGKGKAIAPLLPANLTVATHLLCTPWQPDLSRFILALEDVGEAPYRIDRLLTFWRMSGAFARVKGIALGRFSQCEPPLGSSSWTVAEVLRDRLGDLKVPIVSDLPFGHDGANAALPVGRLVELDGDLGTLNWLAR
jgi:muramoyltetrapeptide carboxypeptidase